jgi:RNA polymerase sigma factor (sigma-70 family)
MYGAAAYSLAVRIVRDRDLAADVVQNTFLAVWTGATQFDAGRGQPSTWIMTMTHHKAVDMVRREQRRRTELLDVNMDDSATAISVEEQAWRGVAGENVRAALARLPDPHREVIELAYFAGYTQSELAARLALPIGTVKSRTFAAMRALRDTLAAAGMHPEDEWNTSTN